jgi:hypothetical protein
MNNDLERFSKDGLGTCFKVPAVVLASGYIVKNYKKSRTVSAPDVIYRHMRCKYCYLQCTKRIEREGNVIGLFKSTVLALREIRDPYEISGSHSGVLGCDNVSLGV